MVLDTIARSFYVRWFVRGPLALTYPERKVGKQWM